MTLSNWDLCSKSLSTLGSRGRLREQRSGRGDRFSEDGGSHSRFDVRVPFLDTLPIDEPPEASCRLLDWEYLRL